MVTYTCPRCGFTTVYRNNMRRHYARDVPCEPQQSNVDFDSLFENFDVKKKIACNLCCKTFNSKRGLLYHQKQHSENENDMSNADLVKELIELKRLVKNMQTSPTTNNIQNQQNNNMTVNSTIVVMQQPPHVQRNNFGQETIDHITGEFVKEALLNLRKGAVDLFQKVHFDPDVPRNNNIAFKSAKSKQVNAVVEGTWQSRPTSTAVEDIVRKVLQLMSLRFNEHMGDNELQRNKDQIFKWMHDVLNMNNDKYFKLKQDIVTLIQNQTDIYNPMLDDRQKVAAMSIGGLNQTSNGQLD